MAGTYLVSLDSLTFFLLQGVEFFDEKLNSLCMAWLVDHGASPAGWGGVLVLQEGYMGIGWGREGAESLVQASCCLCGSAPLLSRILEKCRMGGRQSRSRRGGLVEWRERESEGRWADGLASCPWLWKLRHTPL